jgi:hypothetical protein
MKICSMNPELIELGQKYVVLGQYDLMKDDLRAAQQQIDDEMGR